MAATIEAAPGAVTLRPVGAEALPVLARLYVQMAAAHGHAVPEAAAAEKLRLGLEAGQEAVLFELGPRPVGCAIWADLGDHRMIRAYVIDMAFRRRGLGAALFARLRGEVFADGRPVRLEASGPGPRAFWEAQGLRAWSVGLRTDPV